MATRWLTRTRIPAGSRALGETQERTDARTHGRAWLHRRRRSNARTQERRRSGDKVEVRSKQERAYKQMDKSGIPHERRGRR